ncbi:D-alanine--D-alanine ligase [bacterium]|nr:D-alanine--D-alanine ligase [bacterium]
MKKNIIVVMGGWSPEAPISMRSGKNAFKTLDREKYNVRAVILKEDRTACFLGEDETPKEEDWKDRPSENISKVFTEVLAWPVDAALLALHGCGGEDGCFQGFLSTLGIPFTHSGVTASAVAMEKDIAKLLYAAAGIRIPRGVTVSSKEDPIQKIRSAGLRYPVIAKPLASGSSFGLWLLNDEKELKDNVFSFWLNGGLYLFEEFIRGREFTCVVATREGVPVAMPVTEIVSLTGELFDFKAKYTKGSSEEITPARISEALSKEIRAAAEICHRALRCQGVSRTDFIVNDRNEIYALETNTIPGMSEASILPKAALGAGLTFSQILDDMLSEALKSAE